jgi:hypothetical protein
MTKLGDDHATWIGLMIERELCTIGPQVPSTGLPAGNFISFNIRYKATLALATGELVGELAELLRRPNSVYLAPQD